MLLHIGEWLALLLGGQHQLLQQTAGSGGSVCVSIGGMERDSIHFSWDVSLKLEHEGALLVAKAHRFHREVELKEGESREGSATCTAC